MTAGGPVPLVLLTGFLGAGKTTLLNRLLREPGLARSAVVINEFGDVGIDHLMVERVDGDHLSLTTGCICCAARGDLVDAVAGLLARRGKGRGFDRILIETTGLADPRPILDALLLDPALRQTCRLDTVLTVVDAENGPAVLAHRQEARRQVALADAIILSKLDLIEPAHGIGETPVPQRLGTLNPLASVIDGRQIKAVLAALCGGPAGQRQVPSAAEAGNHRHDPHGDVASAVLRGGPLDPCAFDAFLGLLLQRHGDHLLRLKGLVATHDDPSRPHVVQVVGRRIHPGARLDAWPDADRGTRLAAIVEGMPVDAVIDLWDDMFGAPAIDRPDAAALMGSRQDGAGLF